MLAPVHERLAANVIHRNVSNDSSVAHTNAATSKNRKPRIIHLLFNIFFRVRWPGAALLQRDSTDFSPPAAKFVSGCIRSRCNKATPGRRTPKSSNQFSRDLGQSKTRPANVSIE